jgi:hypothetical protein
MMYAIRVPANESLKWEVAEILFRPPGRPRAASHWCGTRVSHTRRGSGRSRKESSPRSGTVRASCFRESALSDGQKRAIGTPLISLGPALVANSLCREQEKCTMREPEFQTGNSG